MDWRRATCSAGQCIQDSRAAGGVHAWQDCTGGFADNVRGLGTKLTTACLALTQLQTCPEQTEACMDMYVWSNMQDKSQSAC